MAMKPQQGIRLFLADVDGALVTREKALTEAAKAAVRELRAAGIAFAITSGRPPRGMSMLIEPLALTGPIARFNGGVFVNPDLSVIESHILDLAAARQALALIEEAGLDAWLYTETEWLIRDAAAPHVAREALGDRASAARSQPYYLDVTHPRATKGEVVRTLSRILGIPPAQIATLGDMPNDVLMFRESGFSIAMGNASDEVKAQASAVIESSENEGFADAVRRFILKP
jgi:hydroxymethylpyrimidine pyrophosphatase-like HAD family hydrolase